MEVARAESYLRVGLTEFGDQMDVWVRKKEEVKNDPTFLDWTSKTVLPFSEIGTRGRRKRIYSILDLCASHIFMGRCSVGGWKVIWKLGRLI